MDLSTLLKLIDQGVSVVFFLAVMFGIFKYTPKILECWAGTNIVINDLKHALNDSRTKGDEALRLMALNYDLLVKIHASQAMVEAHFLKRPHNERRNDGQ